jgi:hypothetical protein
LAVVTIHDACPAFSSEILKFTEELEALNIKYNVALIPFFNEKQDLLSFPAFVKKIKSLKRCEIALHGLYHEDRNGHQVEGTRWQHIKSLYLDCRLFQCN